MACWSALKIVTDSLTALRRVYAEFLLQFAAALALTKRPEILDVKALNRLEPISLLVLRLVLGTIFLYHGYPKLAHTHGNMQGLFVEHGMPGYFVYVAGIIETFGGGLFLLGLFTRPAALLVAAEMCVAIWKVHSGHGYFAVYEYEFPLILAAACFALATVGAGLISLDHPLFEGGGGGGRGRASRGGRGERD
jgi:putative oxidoreductase